MKLYVDGQANMIQEDDYDNEDEIEALDNDEYFDDPEDTGFMILDELNTNVSLSDLGVWFRFGTRDSGL